MNSESAGHREQPDVPGTPNAPSTRPRAFHRRRRTDGPAFTRPDQYLGQNFYPLLYALALRGEKEPIEFFNDEIIGKSVSMTSLVIGFV